MTKFKGQLSLEVTFNGLQIPNGFDKWIDELKIQLATFEKTYNNKNFEVKTIKKRYQYMKNKQTKKVQIKMFKKEDKQETIFNSIDIKSLELYAEMMRDRYGRM